MRVAIVLFTRDLRVHDHPALACAAQSAHAVAPLFVLDPTVLGAFGAANRVARGIETCRLGVVLEPPTDTSPPSIVRDLRKSKATKEERP